MPPAKTTRRGAIHELVGVAGRSSGTSRLRRHRLPRGSAGRRPSDLRAADGHKAQSRSIYSVHAAVGLSVSDTLLYGYQTVTIEGHSDQTYLSAIKNYLIGRGA